MESWCFDSLDTGYVSNETLVRNKGVRDFKITSNYENSNLSQSQLSVENHGFSELGFSEIVRTQIPNDSVKNVFYNESSVGDIVSPSMVTSSPVFGEEELNSSSRESSLIEVKLGGVSDGLNCNSSRSAPFSSESSTRVKRVKGTSFSCQTVCCQVHGCNKDLSSAKDYHKRHKVCDAHSKTSKVIVNGVEQRFCQQCSRFHLVGEFDEGKRSCRKRLAGHNERRRKPQVGYINGRARRSFLYTGSVVRKFQRTPPEAAFFSCPDTLQIDASHSDNIRTNGWGALVKIEDETNYDTKFSNIFINGQLQENTVLSPFLLAKQYCSIDNIRDNKLGENVTQIPHEIVSHSLVQMNSLGSQDLSYTKHKSTLSETGCALSLLSAQAQNSSNLPSGTSRDHTSVIPNTSPHYSVSEVSQKLLGVGSQGLTSGNQKCFSLGRNNESTMSSVSNGDFANSSFESRILQGSDFVNVNNSLSCEEGTTVNLLQLSSQLHRVENPRQTAIGKHETEFLVSWNDIRDQI